MSEGAPERLPAPERLQSADGAPARGPRTTNVPEPCCERTMPSSRSRARASRTTGRDTPSLADNSLSVGSLVSRGCSPAWIIRLIRR